MIRSRIRISDIFHFPHHCGIGDFRRFIGIALYINLMKRHVPVALGLLENWLSDCFACVMWNNSWSFVFKVQTGICFVAVFVLSIC